MKEVNLVENRDYVSEWFELTYSSYMILHRSLLQSMPKDWQSKFITLVEELDATFGDLPELPLTFVVTAKKDNKFYKDPYRNYRRQDARIREMLEDKKLKHRG